MSGFTSSYGGTNILTFRDSFGDYNYCSYQTESKYITEI